MTTLVKIKIPYLYMDCEEGRKDWSEKELEVSIWMELYNQLGYDRYRKQIVKYYNWDTFFTFKERK